MFAAHASLARQVYCGAHGGGVQPGGDIAPNGPGASGELEKRLLHRIFDIGAIVKLTQAGRVHHPLMRADQLLEGLGITVPSVKVQSIQCGHHQSSWSSQSAYPVIMVVRRGMIFHVFDFFGNERRRRSPYFFNSHSLSSAATALRLTS